MTVLISSIILLNKFVFHDLARPNVIAETKISNIKSENCKIIPQRLESDVGIYYLPSFKYLLVERNDSANTFGVGHQNVATLLQGGKGRKMHRFSTSLFRYSIDLYFIFQ